MRPAVWALARWPLRRASVKREIALLDGSLRGYRAQPRPTAPCRCVRRNGAAKIPSVEAQPHQQRLAGAVGRADGLFLRGADGRRVDPLRPGFRGAVAGGGEQLAAQRQAPMRAGADAGIVLIAPIGEIVPAFRRPAWRSWRFRRRCRPKRAASSAVASYSAPASSSSGSANSPLRVQRGEFRAVLDGELVEREMVGGQGQRLAQLRPPCRLLCPGRA